MKKYLVLSLVGLIFMGSTLGFTCKNHGRGYDHGRHDVSDYLYEMPIEIQQEILKKEHEYRLKKTEIDMKYDIKTLPINRELDNLGYQIANADQLGLEIKVLIIKMSQLKEEYDLLKVMRRSELDKLKLETRKTINVIQNTWLQNN